jgi:DHA2 family multidrug resistance protein
MSEGLLRRRALRLFPSLSSSHPAYPWYVLLTVMLGTFMVVLDGTIVNVAIPTIMTAFGKTINQVVWVATAYLIALSILLGVSGWLSDHLGTKRAYMLGLLIFVGSSYLCGIAWNLHTLILFRIIQGVGGGILTPVGMLLFTNEFKKENRTIALGFYSIAVAAAISLGPCVGGYLIQVINWKWIFFINLPFGAITILCSWAVLKKVEPKEMHAFDFWGFFSLTGFLGMLFWGISCGNAPWNAEGWGSHYVFWSFLAAAIFLIIFLYAELRTPYPIIDLRIFKDRNFLMGNIVLFVFSFTLFGSSFLLPLYLQNGLDYSQITTGYLLLPIGIAQGVFGGISGWLTKRIPPRFLVVSGIVLLAFTYSLNSRFSLYTEEAHMVMIFSLRGAAMGLLFAPLVAMTMSTIPDEKLSHATGLFSVQRQIGAALGVAVFETIFTVRQVYHSAQFGAVIDTTNPLFVGTQASLKEFVVNHLGKSLQTAAAYAQEIIQGTIQKQVFIQAIDDNILLAGIITLFSSLPLFFLRKKIN